MKTPRWIVPVLIIMFILAGLQAARMISIPSVTLEFPGTGTVQSGQKTVLLVDGVKCVDTARMAASTLEKIPGVIRFVAFASRNRVEITFDPARTDIQSLCRAIEGPVYNKDSGEFLFHQFKVIEIDGRRFKR